MAQIVKETVTIQELTRYWFKANDIYYGWSKQLKDSDKMHVVPGAVLEMEIYIAESGKKYCNKVIAKRSEFLDDPGAVKIIPKSTEVKKEVVKPIPQNEAMTRADWDSKDRRISRQGAIQAAVQAVSSISSLEDLFTNAETLANKMLEFVNK